MATWVRPSPCVLFLVREALGPWGFPGHAYVCDRSRTLDYSLYYSSETAIRFPGLLAMAVGLARFAPGLPVVRPVRPEPVVGLLAHAS